MFLMEIIIHDFDDKILEDVALIVLFSVSHLILDIS